MSILIRGMEMPKSCYACDFSFPSTDSEGGVYTICTALQEEILPLLLERQEDCPLVEVATPHGKLIDADAIPYLLGTTHEKAYDVVPRFMIDKMPTVIEADRPDEVTDVGCKVCNTNCYEAGTDGEMCSAWTKKPTVEAEEET